MQPNELKQLTALVSALAAAFNRDADQSLFTAFKLGCGDLPIADVERGVGRAIRECKFMPSPAELRELSGVMTPKHRAVLAWDAFDAAVGREGFYRSVDFDDRLINATVRNLGGWREACEKPADEFATHYRREFERVYVALCTTGISPEQAAPLTGEFARVNQASGQPVAPPVLIETGLPKLPQLTHERKPLAQIGGAK